MKLSRKGALWTAVVCALAMALLMLGVLQYRWSKEISEAASSRMRTDLTRSMIDFRQDFLRELATVAHALEPNYGYGSDFESYAAKLANWRRTASYPGMVQDVYIWQHGPVLSQLLKINSPGDAPERVEWPPSLAHLRAMTVTTPPAFKLFLPSPDLLLQGPQLMPTEADIVGVEFAVPPEAVTRLQATRVAVAEGSVREVETPGYGRSIDAQHEAVAGQVPKLAVELSH